MRRRWYFIAPLAILGMLAFIAIGGEVVRLLWNWLLPGLFGWPAITFWQAVALLALCRILFGGLGMRGPLRSNVRRRMAERWEQRWQQMTPEEREKFRESFRGRCGRWEPPNPSATAQP
jgi:hypothetical protein